jgi:hypothetical protein
MSFQVLKANGLFWLIWGVVELPTRGVRIENVWIERP